MIKQRLPERRRLRLLKHFPRTLDIISVETQRGELQKQPASLRMAYAVQALLVTSVVRPVFLLFMAKYIAP